MENMNRPLIARDITEMKELHRCYMKYVKDLGLEAEQPREYPMHEDFEDFLKWWSRLDPETRRMDEERYRNGLVQHLENERKAVNQHLLETEEGDSKH